MKIAEYKHTLLKETYQLTGDGMCLELAWKVFDIVCRHNGWTPRAEDIKVRILTKEIHEIK
jgi:hypothetical protein